MIVAQIILFILGGALMMFNAIAQYFGWYSVADGDYSKVGSVLTFTLGVVMIVFGIWLIIKAPKRAGDPGAKS